MGLPVDPAPSLHLPMSPLTRDWLQSVNSSFDKFSVEQSANAYLPLPPKRYRRFYRTAEMTFPAPFQIPPGVAPLLQETSQEAKRRSTIFNPSLANTQEVLLSGLCETSSWMDLALLACATYAEHLPPQLKPEFERMILSIARANEAVSAQAMTALGNHVLAKRDSLLKDVQTTVPAESLMQLRHAPLPLSSPAIFPPALLEVALTKSRASASDALVRKTLHPPKIPKKTSSGFSKAQASSSTTRGGESPVVPRAGTSQQQSRPSSSGQQGKRKKRGGQGRSKTSAKGAGRKGGGKRHS